MKVGQFSTPVAKLYGAMEALQRAWADAQQHWDDATSENLERVHLEPILRELKEIIESTVPLSEGMAQAQRACAPRGQNDES
ncbi:MAG TPA: hypothetical protein VMR25_04575 [Planctomycetaceae bacterium]|nr:hypothetical protein [Planctomycetaceae bacterium]